MYLVYVYVCIDIYTSIYEYLKKIAEERKRGTL